jgi:hypothetical protein
MAKNIMTFAMRVFHLKLVLVGTPFESGAVYLHSILAAVQRRRHAELTELYLQWLPFKLKKTFVGEYCVIGVARCQ